MLSQNFPKRILECGKVSMDGRTGYESTAEIIKSLLSINTLSISETGLQNREVLFVSDLDA